MGKYVKTFLISDFRTLLTVFFLLVITMGSARAAGVSEDAFMTLYPGVYTEREKALVEKYIADNKAIEDRGEIDIKALINGKLPRDTPGVGPVVKVTEELVRYYNQIYDPENPIFHDAEYAKSLGYKDILAYPTFAACDDVFMSPYPTQARDTLMPSDLNHSVTSYKPIYPGDTLYLVYNKHTFTEVTPLEGSIYRTLAIENEGSIYNQDGEKVSDVVFRATESIRIYKEGKAPKKGSMWDEPEWSSTSRPAYYYSDEDWEYIKDLWAKEKVRGSSPLYWEDVKIGDEPPWTVEGPVEVGPSIAVPYGMGVGASRTMKKEIMDPEIFKTMIRGEKDGIYRLPEREDYVPPVPENQSSRMGDFMDALGEFHAAVPEPSSPGSNVIPGGAPDGGPPGAGPGGPPGGARDKEARGQVINFWRRDIAIRHFNNWIGDRGWLYNIRWSALSPESYEAYGRSLPAVNPDAERFLQKVPKLEGKYVGMAGLTGDLAIVKSYVYNKYVRDGEFFVELIWWLETIEGEIWQEGGAIVKLPSKRAK